MEPYRYCISLRITHPYIDPNEISNVLGLKAFIQWKAGDPRINLKGVELGGLRDDSFWRYHPHDKEKISSETRYLEDYLDDLTSSLSKNRDFFASIVNSGGHIEYDIGMFSEHNIGSVLPSQLLKRIADLNIGLSFDIYAYPE